MRRVRVGVTVWDGAGEEGIRLGLRGRLQASSIEMSTATATIG